jgi:uncharacterized protein YerC
MKKRKQDLTEKELIRTLDMLYTAAGTVKGRDAMKTFLRDLLTESERIMLGRRIWIARLLLSGFNEKEIVQKLKVSIETVYRVKRWLKDQFKGYEKAIEELEKEMDKRALKREASADPYSLTALKRKYPLHFLFFPTPKPKKTYRE